MSETDVSGAEAGKPHADDRGDATDPAAAPPSATAASSPTSDDGPDRSGASRSSDSTESSDSSGSTGSSGSSGSGGSGGTQGGGGTNADPARKRRRRGSRGGRRRSKPRTDGSGDAGDRGDERGGGGRTGTTPARASRAASSGDDAATSDDAATGAGAGQQRGGRAPSGRGRGRTKGAAADRNPELPDRQREGRPATVEAAEAALVPKAPPPRPRIGDSIPPEALGAAGGPDDATASKDGQDDGSGGSRKRRRRRGGRGRSGKGSGEQSTKTAPTRGGKGRGRAKGTDQAVEAVIAHEPTELDEETLERRRGRERKGRAVGRYSMCVHVGPTATQIAVLEGRNLIEHYVSRPSDDVSQIHGNVYLARVQNVLPGMEAAFVDIGTPKNAVLYRGDVQYDPEDVETPSKGGSKGGSGRGRASRNAKPRIEDVLKAGQTILCQVTKNPIGAKGARLTQEVSLPGRFVVLIPNSSTYGISKRLPDDERKRLRQILDRVKPAQHGVIVRTAAENVTTEEIEADVRRLLDQWSQIEALAKRSKAPTLLYREPDMAVRVIREEFSPDYRSILIDDRELHAAVRDYVASISPELADRVEYYDPEAEALPLYERHHVHEQVHRALDRKVWLPSGGSLIIEHTEALTVIDVNTGKNVGRSSLEETVFKNNLEAAVEIARQLRLRDVGGIIVVDFIDMEKAGNRDEVVKVFRDALSRDKTRTQVFEISELGLCEMTRKRIGEGLLESFTSSCPDCDGRGVVIDKELLPD
jgi:ribonuclease E